MLTNRIQKHLLPLAGLALAAFFIPSGAAHAASYSELVAQGYKTSTLTQSRGGAAGWILSRGNQKYFCRMTTGMMLVGRDQMVSVSSSGRQSPLNKKVVEQHANIAALDLPRMEDMKAGRPRPKDVRGCVYY